LEDDKQTVTVTHPEIGTSAVDGSDGDRNVIVDDTTEVIDTVEYTGLIPGKEYTVKGTLHVKVTDDEGKVTDDVLKVDGKPSPLRPPSRPRRPTARSM
ncbi:MAG: VaFE repeat-containing surface-anchored protein, partial [Alistipes inops]